ncbi:hypothetical protein [Nostoc sp.]|uniref:hypothetical protein n=1 Tax=Nostoc sp. TaxID=1180 RepID=UPI002FF5D257
MASSFRSNSPQPQVYTQQPERSPQVEPRPFGRAEYEQLKIRSSLTDVRSILGRGTELEGDATMATFVWENIDGSKITATFDEHDRLRSKKQSRLK